MNATESVAADEARSERPAAAGPHRRWVLGGGALAVGVAIAAGVLASLPRPDGPLANGEAGAVVNAFPAGSTVTYGLQTLSNDSPHDAMQITSVAVRQGEPALEILGEAALLGPERVEAMDAGAFDVLAGWPPVDGVEPQPAEGARVAAGAISEYEVVVPLRVPSQEQGIGIIEGFVIEYEAGGVRYREETSMTLVLCPIEESTACEEFDPDADR